MFMTAGTRGGSGVLCSGLLCDLIRQLDQSPMLCNIQKSVPRLFGLSSLRPGFLHDAGHRDFPTCPGFHERGHVVAAPLGWLDEWMTDGGSMDSLLNSSYEHIKRKKNQQNGGMPAKRIRRASPTIRS